MANGQLTPKQTRHYIECMRQWGRWYTGRDDPEEGTDAEWVEVIEAGELFSKFGNVPHPDPAPREWWLKDREQEGLEPLPMDRRNETDNE